MQIARKMIQTVVENWTPRPVIASPSLIGKYVQVDPIDMDHDVPLLWEALGGNDGTINDRLKWYGINDFEEESDLANQLALIEDTPGQ